jgi:transposase
VWKNEFRKSTAEISNLAGCSERTVRNILQFEHDYGVVNNPFAQLHGGRRLLSTGDMDYISSTIQATPVIYLDEIQERLLLYRNIDVSLSTVSCALKNLALTHKKVTHEAIECNELVRACWQAEHGDIPAEYCVWLDEAGVDNHTNRHDEGWAMVGRACVRQTLFLHGRRYSILPAFTCDGYIALDIFEGSVNKERFIGFLNELVSFVYISNHQTHFL